MSAALHFLEFVEPPYIQSAIKGNLAAELSDGFSN